MYPPTLTIQATFFPTYALWLAQDLSGCCGINKVTPSEWRALLHCCSQDAAESRPSGWFGGGRSKELPFCFYADILMSEAVHGLECVVGWGLQIV